MSRIVASVVLALGLVGCASADPGNPVDAGIGRMDASAKLDGSVVLVDAAPMVDAAPTATCTASTTCASATMLGTVSGDKGTTTLTGSGYQAAWYRVRVTEDDSNSIGLALRVAATVTGPSAGAFDVFVYVNAGSDVVECSSTTGTVTTSGNAKTVKAEWGESLIPNGLDDSRNVTIEVRPATSTNCAPSQMWQLQIEGNWL